MIFQIILLPGNHNLPAAVNIDKCGDLATTRVALVALMYGGQVGCVASQRRAMKPLDVATRSRRALQLDRRPKSLAADTRVWLNIPSSVCWQN